MPATFPQSSNVFVPSHEASGKLITDFSRNPSKFALSSYCQYIPVEKVLGYYLEMTVEEAGRILNGDGAELAWPSDADRPSLRSTEAAESFEFKAFSCKRYEAGVPLGDRTIDQASWDIIAQASAHQSQKMMTWRTMEAIRQLTTAANFPASHTSAVASISGNSGNWAASTTARQDIKRSLNHAAERIMLDTLGAVDPADLVVVMSPGCAKAISETQEFADYLKGSPDAYAYVKGDLADQNKNQGFGIPPFLYGYEVVVEKTVRVTSRKGATKATQFVLPDATPFMSARVGGLVGLYGSPSFSTCSVFLKEELTVERLTDVNHRRTTTSVVDDFAAVLTAPISGYLFTSAV